MLSPTLEKLTRALAACEQERNMFHEQLTTAEATIAAQLRTLTLIEHLCRDHPILTQYASLSTPEAVLLAVSTLSRILELLRPGASATSSSYLPPLT